MCAHCTIYTLYTWVCTRLPPNPYLLYTCNVYIFIFQLIIFSAFSIKRVVFTTILAPEKIGNLYINTGTTLLLINIVK